MIVSQSKSANIDKSLRYVLRPNAKLISTNTAGRNKREIAKEMDAIAKTSNKTSIPCYHASLSLHPKDGRIEESKWKALVTDFLDGMGFARSQYVAVRHSDTHHDHVHIVANRVTVDSKVVSQEFDYKRAGYLARALEDKYKLFSKLRNWRQAAMKPLSQLVQEFANTPLVVNLKTTAAKMRSHAAQLGKRINNTKLVQVLRSNYADISDEFRLNLEIKQAEKQRDRIIRQAQIENAKLQKQAEKNRILEVKRQDLENYRKEAEQYREKLDSTTKELQEKRAIARDILYFRKKGHEVLADTIAVKNGIDKSKVEDLAKGVAIDTPPTPKKTRTKKEKQTNDTSTKLSANPAKPTEITPDSSQSKKTRTSKKNKSVPISEGTITTVQPEFAPSSPKQHNETSQEKKEELILTPPPVNAKEQAIADMKKAALESSNPKCTSFVEEEYNPELAKEKSHAIAEELKARKETRSRNGRKF